MPYTCLQANPQPFIPYLQPLADQVASLYAAGQLREGERVLLWEGESHCCSAAYCILNQASFLNTCCSLNLCVSLS
jgi:hypothetical protein